MTGTWEYTLSQSTHPDGLLYYTVLYNGSPLMASTRDKGKAESFLASQVTKALAARRAVKVLAWDGDTGTLADRSFHRPQE